ncbi:short transient receptor potential channel 4-like isoform X2 [Amphiura filiformis]|uniref:short transient receptor potential channel 4-like isoform X2 n=1 Tax=Amphiura filiformis TaxID=82378 RepID=UPI003B217334
MSLTRKDGTSPPPALVLPDSGPNFDSSMEALFLQAVDRGDRKAIIYALDNAPDLNINCLDDDAKSALVKAIENGNSDIVKLLLEHNIQLGDALLRAVDTQFVQGVKQICEHIKKRNIPECINCRALNGDFHPEVTPLVLAAQHNHYDNIRTLLEYGARIRDPRTFSEDEEVHTLENSVGMLNLYKALASQAYISLTAEDPFSETFELCDKLRKLTKTKYEFGDQFQALADQCEQFAADLLDQVRDTTEQIFILNHDPYGWSNPSEDIHDGQPNRVKVAIHFEQRKFVAHPHCQQRLIERWYHGLPGWRDQGAFKSSLLVFLMGFSFPLFSLCYLFVPYGRVANFLKIPYVKFICHTASQLAFLLLLLYHTMIEKTILPQNQSDTGGAYERDGIPSITMVLIILWVAGMTWSKVKELWYNGSRFFGNLWNYFDFFTLLLYWGVIVLQFMVTLNATQNPRNSVTSPITNSTTAPAVTVEVPVVEEEATVTMDVREYVDIVFHDIELLLQKLLIGQDNIMLTLPEQIKTGLNPKATSLAAEKFPDDDNYKRYLWEAYDPVLVADALFSVAKVSSFLRMISLTVVNKDVGPMQISLGGMITDISKFLFIFCFVWFAFSLGMNQLYWYYSSIIPGQPFKSIVSTMATLFWSLFGLFDTQIVNLNDIKHTFTQSVGNVMFAIYHIIAIVVLLNVLIAMMSNTYTRVEMDADMEWKFSRSKLWMSYFDELGTVPPPFNIIPSPKSIFRFMKWVLYCCCREDIGKKYKERIKSIIDERQVKSREISDHLVRRYHFEKRHQDEDDDQAMVLNELKQDISGFKFEMFEALGEMDKKIRQVEAKVHDKEYVEEDAGIGTGMFQAMQQQMKPSDSMESLSSGCSDAMVNLSNRQTDSPPDWMTEEDIELEPLVPVSHNHKAKTEPAEAPNGYTDPGLRFIDEEDALGAHRNTEV